MMRARINKWAHSFWNVFAISLATVVLLFAAAIGWAAIFSPTPAKIISLDKPTTITYCPTFDFDIHISVKVNRQVTLYLSTVVNDETGIINIPETQSPTVALHFPIKAQFKQSVNWKIPELPKGKYTRVTYIFNRIDEEHPTYIVTPFQIGSCEPYRDKVEK